MSTIVVYKRNGVSATIGLTDAERQEGMKDAGRLLRTALSDFGGSGNDADAEDRVKGVLDDLIRAQVGTLRTYDVRLEESRTSTIKYKIVDEVTDKMGRYELTHQDNLMVGDPNNAPKSPSQQIMALNGKLRLDVGLDDLAGKKHIFKMRMTVPRASADAASWIYLSDEINADLVTIGAAAATDVQDYLISTFMFSRCR